MRHEEMCEDCKDQEQANQNFIEIYWGDEQIKRIENMT